MQLNCVIAKEAKFQRAFNLLYVQFQIFMKWNVEIFYKKNVYKFFSKFLQKDFVNRYVEKLV